MKTAILQPQNVPKKFKEVTNTTLLKNDTGLNITESVSYNLFKDILLMTALMICEAFSAEKKGKCPNRRCYEMPLKRLKSCAREIRFFKIKCIGLMFLIKQLEDEIVELKKSRSSDDGSPEPMLRFGQVRSDVSRMVFCFFGILFLFVPLTNYFDIPQFFGCPQSLKVEFIHHENTLIVNN